MIVKEAIEPMKLDTTPSMFDYRVVVQQAAQVGFEKTFEEARQKARRAERDFVAARDVLREAIARERAAAALDAIRRVDSEQRVARGFGSPVPATSAPAPKRDEESLEKIIAEIFGKLDLKHRPPPLFHLVQFGTRTPVPDGHTATFSFGEPKNGNGASTEQAAQKPWSYPPR